MKIETPRGTVFHTKDGKTARLVWNPGFQDTWQGRYDRAQMFVDNEVLRRSDPLIPFQTGMLKKSGILGTIIGSGEVEWIAPYARYLYYGKVYGPNIPRSDGGFFSPTAPKKPTGKEIKFHGAPMRGAFWFERMKSAHKQDILAGARRLAGGGK
ncbi:minor capsid protein [Butyricicoccus faecihominis]|uniref:minor capsid protein n=1 Tax=Butyricicoccus faecihominis TaxID=1712515 RepID=UPI00247A12BF|nr:minor capsid protein [Butyricicoccus faecihominis]